MNSTLIGEGYSSLLFKFGLKGSGLCGEAPCADTVPAELLVDQTRDISANFSRQFYERKQDGAVVATGKVILPSYQFSYDFSSFLVPLPLPFPPIDDTFDIFAELFVGTYSSGEDLNGEPLNFSSAARMASDQSAFLEIDNVLSLNGYNYPGRPSAPQQNGVPAPGSLPLLAIGLVALGLARRRMRLS